MCKVSICIPTYNSSDFFIKTINSIEEQEGIEDFEVVITDDSTNKFVYQTVSKSCIRAKIKYFHNNVALGSPANWNKAITLCKGEYVKLLHHDDWLSSKDSLYKLIKALDENKTANLAFCCSMDQMMNGDIVSQNIPDLAFIKKLEANPAELFLANRIGAPSTTIVRSDKLFDLNLKWLVDVDWYIRILRDNNQFVFVNENLVNIGIHNEQATNKYFGNEAVELTENFYVYKKLLINNSNRGEYVKHLNVLLKKFKITSFKKLFKYSSLGLFEALPFFRVILSQKNKKIRGKI